MGPRGHQVQVLLQRAPCPGIGASLRREERGRGGEEDVQTGSALIGALEAVGVVVLLVAGLAEATEGALGLGLALLAASLLVLLMVALLGLGLHRESPQLILPHLVLQVSTSPPARVLPTIPKISPK